MIYRDGWTSPRPSTAPVPKILKLHGSSNWLTSAIVLDPHTNQIILTQAATPDTLYLFESATKPYPCYDGRYMGGYQPFSFGYYPPNILDDRGKPLESGRVLLNVKLRHPLLPQKGTASDDGLVSMPLIIPPVKNKKYDMFGTLFTHLWNEAENAIALSDRIVIIGYSFPRTDHKSNDLFRKAFMRRSALPTVCIVDPNPEPVAEKMRLEFGVTEDKLTVFKDYFSEAFDISKLFSR